jgi:hypothetical protein
VCNPAGPNATCDLADVCDGTTNACAPVFAAFGTACGNSGNTECDNADSCDAIGNCQPNHEPDGTACNEGDVCTSPDSCENGECEAGPVVGGCKVTGGGELTASGTFPWISFGFNVQTRNGTPPAKGQLEVNRHTAPKAAYHSIEIRSLAITPISACFADAGRSGQKATFSGTIARKGQAQPCEFEVVVEDCGEPGRYDYFSIDIEGPGACPESRSGVLDRGNIQVH